LALRACFVGVRANHFVVGEPTDLAAVTCQARGAVPRGVAAERERPCGPGRLRWPTRYDLYLSDTAAKALGLTTPASVRVRAEEVRP